MKYSIYMQTDRKKNDHMLICINYIIIDDIAWIEVVNTDNEVDLYYYCFEVCGDIDIDHAIVLSKSGHSVISLSSNYLMMIDK